MAVGPLSMHRATLASLANADRYLQDAEALVERGSNGHALALAVLAEEEIGKALLFVLRLGGIEVPRHILIDHSSKQLLEVAVLDLFDFLWKGFRTHFGAASEAGDDATRVKAAKQLHTKLRRKVERKLARPGHRFMVTKHQQLQRLRGLQRIKETGMYVDLRDDGTVGSPSDVDRRTAREYIQVVVGHRSNLTLLFGQVLLPDPSENFLAEVRNQVRPVLAAFTPEIGRMLSWLGDASKNNRRALSRAERERSIS